VAQLFFKYGAMNSGKSIEILKVAHNYEEQNKPVLLFTSAIDDRDQVGYVSSRIGVRREAIPIFEETPIYEIVEGQAVKPYCILIDESQFLSKQHILELARIVDELNIPVMAFGLKNDFQNELFEEAGKLRRLYIEKQLNAGLDFIPVGDFSLYDHILDLSVQFNVIPQRFEGREVDVDLFFDIARGNKDNVASALKKWFNTNYHYIVPEWENVNPKLNNTRLLDLYKEAKEIVGDKAKPVITGPITYVALSSGLAEGEFEKAVDKLVPLYTQVFKELAEAGASYIQVDEPIFVTDEGRNYVELAHKVYNHFNNEVDAKFIFQTYFEALVEAEKLADLPVAFGLDFVHGREENLANVKAGLFKNKEVFAGVVDGRNVWSNDFEDSSALLEEIKANVAELVIQPSCSLLHVPVTTKNETELEETLLNGLAFADQKLVELNLLANKLDGKEDAAYQKHVDDFNKLQNAEFRNLELESSENVRSTRPSDYKVRREVQNKKYNLPLLPTTTIGSFPQSKQVRLQRQVHPLARCLARVRDRQVRPRRGAHRPQAQAGRHRLPAGPGHGRVGDPQGVRRLPGPDLRPGRGPQDHHPGRGAPGHLQEDPPR